MKKVHENLNSSINFIAESRQKYVHNPETDFTRNRKLTLKDTIHMILSMEGGSLKKELYEFTEQRKIKVSPSAFVQQRSKISVNAFKDIFYQFNKRSNDTQLYKGYRVFAVDGSDINHYRNPDLESFVCNSSCERGYNQTHLNAIFDVCNKTYYDVFLQPRPKSNEQRALIEMLKRNSFQGKNIIIADRGYEGYNMFAHLINTKNLDFVCRVKNSANGIKGIRKLEMKEEDIDLSISLSTTQTKEDKMLGRIYIPNTSPKHKKSSLQKKFKSWDFPSPYTLNIRVVRFQLDSGEYETLVTSLSRDEFGIDDMKKLYHMRWGIETSFRELKYVIGAVNLHAKKEELVFQEIYATLIMYNYCSRVAACATVKKHKQTKYAYKLSFAMTSCICRYFLRSLRIDFKKAIEDICKYIEPVRPGRKDLRNIRSKRFVGFFYRVAA